MLFFLDNLYLWKLFQGFKTGAADLSELGEYVSTLKYYRAANNYFVYF